MLEWLRASRKLGQAGRAKRAGDNDGYYDLLIAVFGLVSKPKVDRTYPPLVGVAAQGARELFVEARRRGDSDRARKVIDFAYDMWMLNTRESPNIRSVQKVREWGDWVEKEYSAFMVPR
jgi:hypothetical protein